MADVRNLKSYKVNEFGIFFEFEGSERILPFHSILNINKDDGLVMVTISLINNTTLTIRVNKGSDFIRNLYNKIDNVIQEPRYGE